MKARHAHAARLFACSTLVVTLLSLAACSRRTREDEPDVIGPRVEALLARMTLEEKVGQMTQVTIDVVSKKAETGQPHALDPAKLEEAIVGHHVGSILNVPGAALSLEHWHEVISQIQDVATKKTRLAIPVIYGIDAVHGANYTLGATVFPQPISLASTWSTDLAHEIGRVTSLEVRASGIPWNFYPVLDMGRQPLWSRLWETFGEDVWLASAMGAAYIGGHDHAATCMKHFVGYGFPWSGKDRTPAWIDERMMRETFLPPFRRGIGYAQTVMVNSSEVNGIPGHANRHLLTEVLKGEWGFQGFVVSDWADIGRLHGRDRVAETPEEAVRLAVMAGVDMSMVPYDYSFAEILVGLVKKGSVPMARIDDAVRRILRVKLEIGLFEDPYPRKDLAAGFASPESRELNLRAARESLVLLKNEGAVLPLRKGTRVLVTGPTADLLSCLNGGWTITWQGDEEARYPKDKPTILRAIEDANGKENVEYVPGSAFDKELDLAAAAERAAKADAVVLCLGEKAYCETPGNIDDLTLEEAQLRLAEAVAGAGKPVILVLAEGRPRVIRRIADRMRGILFAGLPGMEGGKAIADVLFGDANPSGKLPFTYPRYPNALTPYDHKPLEAADGNKYDPEFPFGHGLSYTTFEYRDLTLSAARLPRNGLQEVRVTVKNSGPRAGSETVQLYLTDLFGSVSRPQRQLKGFQEVDLAPGEERSVVLPLGAPELSFIGLDNRPVLEPGGFRVSVGGLQAEFTLE